MTRWAFLTLWIAPDESPSGTLDSSRQAARERSRGSLVVCFSQGSCAIPHSARAPSGWPQAAPHGFCGDRPDLPRPPAPENPLKRRCGPRQDDPPSQPADPAKPLLLREPEVVRQSGESQGRVCRSAPCGRQKREVARVWLFPPVLHAGEVSVRLAIQARKVVHERCNRTRGAFTDLLA